MVNIIGTRNKLTQDKRGLSESVTVGYRDNLQSIEEQLNATNQGTQYRTYEAGRITAGSVLDKELAEDFEENGWTVKNYLSLLRNLYTSYHPGKPLDVPIVNGTPYGLGLEFQVEPAFDGESFDSMIQSLWTDVDVEGYSWQELATNIQDASRNISDLNDVITLSKGTLMLAGMRIYGELFSPGLTRSYSLDENSFGVRFYETEDYNYININAGLTDYERTLDEAWKIAEYLDGIPAASTHSDS